MITYAKVLELGLKHEPIENPENYSWVQINEEAICGAPLNGRAIELDFRTEFDLLSVNFAEAIRERFGEECSIFVMATRDTPDNGKIEAGSMFSGNQIMIAHGLSETLEKNRELKLAFSTVALAGFFGRLKNDDND